MNSSATKYVAIGASDTIGIGTSNPSTEGWVPKFAKQIHAQKMINLGRDASRLADAMKDQLPEALKHEPDVVTIWLAVNDFNEYLQKATHLATYQHDLDIMLALLRHRLGPNARILVGNIPDLSHVSYYKQIGMPKGTLISLVKLWNDTIKGIVERHHCNLVDLFGFWKELASHPEYISEDGFHPSAQGYTRLADVFYQIYSR